MNVKQKLSILFYLRKYKAGNDGKSPLYARVTIDGIKDEISTGCRITSKNWDNGTKTVISRDTDAKKINKKIAQLKVDLERHFDLMQAKHQVATPAWVFESYRSPLNGARLQQEKIENLALSEQIDQFIFSYLQFNTKFQNATADGNVPHPTKAKLLSQQRNKLDADVEVLSRRASSIFDQKERGKTLIMAVDEYLLNFLLLSMVGHRSPNSLEKMMGRKKRLIEFPNL